MQPEKAISHRSANPSSSENAVANDHTREAIMSKLISGYPLVFLPDLACQYGLNEAIVLQQIQYWSNKLKPNSDGFVWVYNSIPEWKRQFPFWSERTIFSTLKKLRDVGVLIAEQRSENAWDKTMHYRINHNLLETPISQHLQDRRRKNCEITIYTETTNIYIDRFNEFWKAYPRKVAKPNAMKAWLKIKPDDALVKTIIDAIKRQGLCDKEIQFVPHPATWLNSRRWEDEIDSVPIVDLRLRGAK